MFQTVKLAKLRLSPINVRTAEDKALAIEPLAADITARGVLQNLLITPVNKPRGMFEVFDGGRRLRALLLMVERGAIVAEDYDVPVMVLKADKNALSETSLAANFHQLKLTPAEECRAFLHFLGKDGDIDAVASRFGQTRRFIEGRRQASLVRKETKLACQTHRQLRNRLPIGSVRTRVRPRPAGRRGRRRSAARYSLYGSPYSKGLG